MTKAEFITELEFILNVAEGSLTDNLPLETLKTWDSVGKLSVLTLFAEIGLNLKVDQLRSCQTVAELISLADSRLS
ncbi:MAG: hypothetical protein Q4C95_07790 [Planctomycetia bacterium]|nr:hypothetical protein [Planctomycetia bacterium]